jgi:phage-related protein
MSDFNYKPSYGSDVTDEYRTQRAQFGGGYVQESPDGINPVRDIWRLVFENIPRATGDAIRTFLKSKCGLAFTWTPPGGTEANYKLRGEVNMPFTGGDTVNLTCTFERHFGP